MTKFVFISSEDVEERRGERKERVLERDGEREGGGIFGWVHKMFFSQCSTTEEFNNKQ